MEKIAKFEKVSFNQFLSDYKSCFPAKPDSEIKEIYDAIKLPKRATKGSAGYDFCAPVTLIIKPGETVKVPTGIRVQIEDGYVLAIFPRSSLGFKFRLQLDNTVGIIDADYYNAENEGHIFVKLTNDSHDGKTAGVLNGAGFAQGIFLPFGITIDDNAKGKRVGGFGSTNKK